MNGHLFLACVAITNISQDIIQITKSDHNCQPRLVIPSCSLNELSDINFTFTGRCLGWRSHSLDEPEQITNERILQ